MEKHITIDYADVVSDLKPFWKSTGFTPANLLLDADMKQTAAYLGALPHKGIQFVRIHYLLELVTAEGLGTPDVAYDWSILDTGLDVLVRNGLKPVFELMGNVAGYFTDYTQPVQAFAWKDLVCALAVHLEERYGQEEVRTWLFETWNEPDIGFWKQSDEAFCIYYDACSEGLLAADSELILGGPGTCQGLSSTFTSFLAHCDSGTNFFTGETGVRVQFISVHEKGVGSHDEDLQPDTAGIIKREQLSVDYITAHHPRLAVLPFANDECDPQVGWGTIHTWRALPYYAALVAKMLNQHIQAIVDEKRMTYGLLSNDNGFLGTWGHRTHLARFAEYDHIDHGQADNKRDGPRNTEDVRRRKFELIKKPVFTVMSMLSMLGDQRIAHTGTEDWHGELGVIATRRGADQVAVLIYNSSDVIHKSGCTPVQLSLHNLPFYKPMLATYRLDEKNGNPFRVWERQGAPHSPTAEQYAAMRAEQELPLLSPTHIAEIADGSTTLEIAIPLPSVTLLLITADPDEAPEQVTGLRAERFEGMTELEDVLLVWDGLESRALQTYEVWFAPDDSKDFTRINTTDQLDSAYLHMRSAAHGRYKVRAVDYWTRCGAFSEALAF